MESSIHQSIHPGSMSWTHVEGDTQEFGQAKPGDLGAGAAGVAETAKEARMGFGDGLGVLQLKGQGFSSQSWSLFCLSTPPFSYSRG